MNRSDTRLARRCHSRRGTAMIVAIICLTLTSAMVVSLVRLALVSHRQAERGQWQIQSVWLAESGLSRAAARLHSDADYTGEEWMVHNIGPRRDEGTVTITVAADAEDDSQRTVTSTADFPRDPTNRVRTTRTITYRRGGQSTAPKPSEEE